MEFEIDVFVKNVKEEMLGYEEATNELLEIWETGFFKILDEGKINDKNLLKKKGKIFFVIEDEMEIFDIVDEFFEAYSENLLEKYWDSFI